MEQDRKARGCNGTDKRPVSLYVFAGLVRGARFVR